MGNADDSTKRKEVNLIVEYIPKSSTMKLLSTLMALATAFTPIEVPSDTIEIKHTHCGVNGPFDRTAELVHTLGTVYRVSISKCSWVGQTCGLVRGDTNAIFIEYTLDHAGESFESNNNKRIKKFPKKVKKGKNEMSATIDVCGHIMGVMKNFCAPFALPDINACSQGLECTRKGSKIPKTDKERNETRVIKVEIPINHA